MKTRSKIWEKKMKHIKKESDGTAGSRNHGTVREGAAYLVFGVLTTLIDYVISNGLFYLAHMDPVPAQSIAWAAAVLFAFVTNKWWVFGSHTLEPRAVWGSLPPSSCAGSPPFYLIWPPFHHGGYPKNGIFHLQAGHFRGGGGFKLRAQQAGDLYP